MGNLRALLLVPAIAGVTLLASLDTHATPPARNYDPIRTAVRIDGVVTVRVAATVVDTQTAAGTTSDATLKLQPQQAGSTLLAWMSSTLDGHGSRKNVELLTFDSGYAVTESETLDQPFLEQMDLPALDSTSILPAPWTVRLSTATSHATGAQPPFTNVVPSAQASTMEHFRVQIDGIDGSRITKVEPITVRTTLLPPPPPPAPPLPGAKPRLPLHRIPAAPTSTSTVSNLVLTTRTSGNTLSGFQQWLAGDHAARGGQIVYLHPDLQHTLCTVQLKNVVVTKVTTDSSTYARVELTLGGLALSCP
jgi:hypothetical protein